MSDGITDDIRQEAAVRAHSLAIKWWDERKISADFTTIDEIDLVDAIIGVVLLYKKSVEQVTA